jgi:hypothetical protein
MTLFLVWHDRDGATAPDLGSVSGMGKGYKGNKTCIVGMLEREGELLSRVVGSRTKEAMRGLIHTQVLPARPSTLTSSAGISTWTSAASSTSRWITRRGTMPTRAARGQRD